MRKSSTLSPRFWAVTLGMLVGALSTVAVGPIAAMGGACNSVCSMDSGENCPAGGSEADELCAEQNKNCLSADYCAMGLCYDENGNYWLIACTDSPF